MKNILLVTASALLIMMVFYWDSSSQKQEAVRPAKVAAVSKQPTVPSAKALNEQINKHLQEMELKKSFNQMSAELEWDYSRSALPSEMPNSEDENQPQVLDTSVQDAASKVYADLNPDEKGMRTVLPAERIQSRIAHRQWTKEYDQSLRREYVHAFVDNMRNDGFQVKINEDLEVVAVEKKNFPKTMNLDQAIEKASSVPR